MQNLKQNFKNILVLAFALVSLATQATFSQAYDPRLTNDMQPDVTTLKADVLEDALCEYFEYSVIVPDQPTPHLGPWKGQPFFKETYTIDGCEVIIYAEWACRYAYDGSYELYITRLKVTAKTKECYNKIKDYIAQITDYTIAKLASRAECWPFSMIECGKPTTPNNVAYKVYINTCGYIEYRYFHKYMIREARFTPCKTKSFCRIKYTFCYELVNGVMKLKIKSEKDNEEFYSCPPYEEYYDPSTGTMKDRPCYDENCDLRKGVWYEMPKIPVFPKPDKAVEGIDGKPVYDIKD